MHNFCHGKSSQKWLATLVFFKKLSKENSRPFGENSPNVVTLVPNLTEIQVTCYTYFDVLNFLCTFSSLNYEAISAVDYVQL
jgi:hypothetical protein